LLQNAIIRALVQTEPVPLPSGFVTFMFTDIVGSTRLHSDLGERFVELIEAHNRLLREVAHLHGGRVVKVLGDGLLIAFNTGADALEAAQRAQARVGRYKWPGDAAVSIRVGLHAGEAAPRSDDYVSLALHQAARVVAAAQGGQVLLTEAVAAQVDRTRLHYLGRFRLRDFDEPQRLYQPADGEPAQSPHAVTADAWFARPRTSFVGRAKELAYVRDCVLDDRLVTLVAPGGAGKTRLAFEVAADVSQEDRHEVWLADLAALRVGSSVDSAIAAAVGAGDDTSVEPLEAAVAALTRTRGLLVLDNCEHVIEQAAAATDMLLSRAPEVTILATSRAPLRVPGERVVQLEPLELPAPEVTDPATLLDLDAIRLFVARATAAGLDVDLSSAAPTIASIVRKLDGLPLALELAAARAPAFGLLELDRALDEPLQVLDARTRGGADRHQTLDRLIRWSYDLLDDDERAVLRRVSVFGGGCTLAAAAEVCAFGGVSTAAARAALTSLNEKSLLRMIGGEAGTRFRALVSIGLFARDRARECGEYDECIKRHLHWVTSFAQSAEVAVHGADQLRWLRAMRDEASNVQSAGERALQDDPQAALVLAVAAAEPLRWTRQARAMLEASLAAAVDAPAGQRARGRFLLMMDDWTTAGESPDTVAELQELIGVMEAAQDTRSVAEARILLASYLDRVGEQDQAQAELEQARLLAIALDDAYLLATVEWERGWELIPHGEFQRSETHLIESAAAFGRSGNRLLQARVTLGLGWVRGAQGNWASQAELARAALATFDEFGAERPRFLAHVRIMAAERELGNLRVAAHHGRVGWQGLSRLGRAEPYVLSDMGRETAMLLAVVGDTRTAAIIFGWQRALIEATGALEDAPEQEVITRTSELIHSALPSEADALIAQGAVLADDTITNLARTALEQPELGD
jgi:predicted ATPase/class 3 adenylate cyclase